MRVAAEVGSTANRYQILAKLAVGGMAEIFLARGASVAGVERYCVLKRILRERATDEQLVRMFVEEARLAAQLQHPNIASVYDVGTLGDSYFFTMEYVHGETVRAVLHRAYTMSRSVPLACVMTVIAGAAAGLHHAHERHGPDGRPLGIVHRDVSPSNLMISFEGNLKLVDFGVAKSAGRETETRSGTVKGKISYLSPEQCRGVPVDRRSDIFSLGIVMWEMLTGARLFRRNGDFENMTAIVHEVVPPPSSRRPDVPRALDDIVMKMLAKDVSERYQTADEVIEAIENASMRAGTLLSTSAVSRLLRDLFGTRPEPWRELAVQPHEVATVMSQPISEELARQMRDSHHDLSAELDPRETDPAEPVLASVPDLSTSGRMDAEDDPDQASEHEVDPASIYSVSTMAAIGFHEEQTSGDGPDDEPDEASDDQALPTDEIAAIAVTPTPVLMPSVLVRPPTAPPVASGRPGSSIGPSRHARPPTVPPPQVNQAPTERMSPSELLASMAHAAKPGGGGKSSQSTLLGVGAPESAPGVPPPSTFAPGFAPTFPAPTFSAPTFSAPTTPTPFAISGPGPRFAMSAPYPHNATALPLPLELPTSSDLIPLPDAFGTGPSPSLAVAGPHKPRSVIAIIAVVVLAVSIGAIAAVVSRHSAAPQPGTAPTPQPAATAPVAPTPVPPTPAPTVPAITPAPAAPPTTPPAPDPAATVTPPPTADSATPEVAPPSAEDALAALRGLVERKDYAGALAVCAAPLSASPTMQDIARLCVTSACYRRETLTARRWFSKVSARRAALVASCKQAGNIDLTPRLDCSSNPLDCR